MNRRTGNPIFGVFSTIIVVYFCICICSVVFRVAETAAEKRNEVKLSAIGGEAYRYDGTSTKYEVDDNTELYIVKVAVENQSMYSYRESYTSVSFYDADGHYCSGEYARNGNLKDESFSGKNYVIPAGRCQMVPYVVCVPKGSGFLFASLNNDVEEKQITINLE